MLNSWMYLYLISFPNGKHYAGISVNPQKRYKRHLYNAKTQRKPNCPVYLALRKYSSKMTLLMHGPAMEILQAEIDFIAKYRLNERDFGYNISIGGSAPMLGKKHSPSTLQKLKGRVGPKSWLGKKFSEEHKQKMRDARKLRPESPAKGCQWSDESRAKIMKISDVQAENIRNDPRTQLKIAEEYKISQAQVCRIKKGIRRARRSM